jgi:hypothetical protein
VTEIPYRKAVGEFNTLIDKQLDIFNVYGMGVHIPAIGLEITKAAMKLHRELSKVDKIGENLPEKPPIDSKTSS